MNRNRLPERTAKSTKNTNYVSDVAQFESLPVSLTTEASSGASRVRARGSWETSLTTEASSGGVGCAGRAGRAGAR